MGALGAGGPYGERELRAGDRPDGHRGGGGPAALLLSDPDRRVVCRLCAARTALTSVTEKLRASLAGAAARIRRRLTTLAPAGEAAPPCGGDHHEASGSCRAPGL